MSAGVKTARILFSRYRHLDFTALKAVKNNGRQNCLSIRLLSVATLILSLQNCVVIPITTTQIKKPVVYSDLPFERTRHFVREEYFLFWGPFHLSGQSVEEIVSQELQSSPEASGLKNFKVRIYDDPVSSGGAGCYALLPIISCSIAIVSAMFGFTQKRVRVSGDLYVARRSR